MKKKKNNSILIIFLFVAAVAVFYGVRYVQTPVNTQTAIISQHRDSITADAYIIKTEHVYSAEKAGTFYSAETDGARVGKNRQIASVYTGNIDMDAMTELNNINKKIAENERTMRASSTFVGDVQNEENKTDTIKDKIIEAADDNDISKISAYKNELSSDLNGQTSGAQQSIDILKQEKAAVEQRLSGMKQDILSEISGIYTTNVDGLENVLTPESILTYTVADFDALTPPEKKSAPTNTAVGDKICKVVDNHTWSIMVKVNADKLSSYKAGDSVSLVFDSAPGIEANAEIKYISEPSDGFVVAVFESEKYVESIFTVRTSSVEIIFNSYTGYSVPVHAVRVVNGQTGVMKQKRGSEVFCACDVLYTNGEEGYSVVYPTEEAEHELQNGDYVLLGEKTTGGS